MPEHEAHRRFTAEPVDSAPAESPGSTGRGRFQPAAQTEAERPASPNVWPAFGAILVLGLGIRAWLVLTPGLGHRLDLDLFANWMRAVVQHGVGRFHAETPQCNYPPLMLYIWWSLGKVAGLLGCDLSNNLVIERLLKLPACLADLGIAVTLYSTGKALLGRAKAVGASSLYFLNPVSIYNSAYWGQVDSLHSLLVLGTLVLIYRGKWWACGVVAAAALLQKLQSAAFMPLILFELLRSGGRRGLGKAFAAGSIAAALVFLPFAVRGTLGTAVHNSFVRVIGQYPELSHNAMNLWSLLGSPESYDSVPPKAFVRIVSDGRDSVGEDESVLLQLTWRRLSLWLFALAIAGILSLYARQATPIALFHAAGLSGLAFFLFPTEMHERYALPVLAVLPLWAVQGAWRERVFMVLSALLLLNLLEVLPPVNAGPHIAGGTLALFLGLLLIPGLQSGICPSEVEAPSAPAEPLTPRSPAYRVMAYGTIVASLGTLVFGGWLAVAAYRADGAATRPNELFLSELTPQRVVQEWRRLSTDGAVSGGVMHLGDRFFLRGLGTHAPSQIVFDVPARFDRFRALVGIDRATGGRGRVQAIVELDEKEVFRSETLKGEAPPLAVDIALGGAKRLTLRADPTPDGKKFDHLDWALARLVRDEPERPAPAP